MLECWLSHSARIGASTELSCNLIAVFFNPCCRIYSACCLRKRSEVRVGYIVTAADSFVSSLRMVGFFSTSPPQSCGWKSPDVCVLGLKKKRWYLIPPYYHLLLSYLLNGVLILGCRGAKSFFPFSPHPLRSGQQSFLNGSEVRAF